MTLYELLLVTSSGEKISLGFLESEVEVRQIITTLNTVLPIKGGGYQYHTITTCDLVRILNRIASVTDIIVKER